MYNSINLIRSMRNRIIITIIIIKFLFNIFFISFHCIIKTVVDFGLILINNIFEYVV